MTGIQNNKETSGFFEYLNCQNLWQRNTHISVEETIRNVDLIIDWFEFTVKGKNIDEVLADFGLNMFQKEITIIGAGLFGYDITYVYGEKIKFMMSTRDNKLDDKQKMGVHVILSGKACREFEQKWSWYWLMQYCQRNNCNISRIDIAYDSFTDKYFTIAKIRNSLKRGNVSAKAKKALENTQRKILDGSIIGETVKFGSSESETSICFYNKLQERASANYIVSKDIKHWYRCELRLRRDAAKNYLNKVLQNPENISVISLGVLKNYIDFKPRQDMTKNKSRKQSVQWWGSFIGECERVTLATKAVQSTISRKQDWLDQSVSKSMAMVLLADIDDLYGDELQKFLIDGAKKIKQSDINMINKHRLEKGGSVIEDTALQHFKERLNLVNIEELPF